MKQRKAVVLEKNGSQLTVLVSDGTFRKMRYYGPAEIGNEIDLSPFKNLSGWAVSKYRDQSQFRRLAGIAAVFLLILISALGWNLYQASTAAAMISMDINPSLELTLNHQGKVLRTEALNSDASTLLMGLEIQGEPWQKAVIDIVAKSIKLKYLNAAHSMVLIGYAPVNDKTLEIKEMNMTELSKQVQDAALKSGIKPQIAVYALTNDELSKANQAGLTPGKYGLMMNAQKAGVPASPGMLNESGKWNQLIQELQVQKKMKKDISKGTVSTKVPGRESTDKFSNGSTNEKRNEKDKEGSHSLMHGQKDEGNSPQLNRENGRNKEQEQNREQEMNQEMNREKNRESSRDNVEKGQMGRADEQSATKNDHSQIKRYG